jgi:hypothetical protein
MKQFLRFFFICFSAAGVQVSLAQYPPGAYEPNILGLPAVPQSKTPVSANTSAKPSAPTAAAREVTNARNAISGEMSVEHGVQDGAGRLIYTTKASFGTTALKNEALAAGRLVQEEFAKKSCSKPCTPIKTDPPQILPDGRLQFALALKPLYRHLTQAQYFAAMQGAPLVLSAEQTTPLGSVATNKAATSLAPTPVITASTTSAAP